MDPIALLARGTVALLGGGALHAAASVFAVRRAGRGATWGVWAAFLAVGLGYAFWVTSRYPPGVPFLLRTYMFSAFLGIPMALCTWVVTRGHDRKPSRPFLSQTLRGTGAFLVGLPLGLVLAALPDALTLFR